MTKKISIAIDGPAAAGKSTVAKIVAQKLQFIYIDTGAMYRAVTYLAQKKGIPYDDEKTILKALAQTEIRFVPSETQQVFLGEENITETIRSTDVTLFVSTVASLPSIREELQKKQQSFAFSGGIVMDGRDIGTVVLPNAELKIFLRASVEERAERRFKENKLKGFCEDLESLKKEIEKRDHLDYTRKHSPLKKADDAIEIDTTSMSIQKVADEILELAQKKMEMHKVKK